MSHNLQLQLGSPAPPCQRLTQLPPSHMSSLHACAAVTLPWSRYRGSACCPAIPAPSSTAFGAKPRTQSARNLHAAFLACALRCQSRPSSSSAAGVQPPRLPLTDTACLCPSCLCVRVSPLCPMRALRCVGGRCVALKRYNRTGPALVAPPLLCLTAQRPWLAQCATAAR